jgi:hypothetical protein
MSQGLPLGITAEYPTNGGVLEGQSLWQTVGADLCPSSACPVRTAAPPLQGDSQTCDQGRGDERPIVGGISGNSRIPWKVLEFLSRLYPFESMIPAFSPLSKGVKRAFRLILGSKVGYLHAVVRAFVSLALIC